MDKENYIYHKHKENADGTKIYWRCENRSCKARIHTSDQFDVLKKIGVHHHGSTAAEVNAKIAISTIKQKCIESRSPPRAILSQELGNLNDCALAEVPKLAHISRNNRRWRQVEDNFPPIPHEIIGSSIPPDYSYLDNGSIFLQYDSGIDDPKRILIFATNEAIEDLKQCKNWAGDGTFKICPNIFFQLYVLHIQIHQFSAPRLFALLPDKAQMTYERLFRKIKDLVNNEAPQTILMDFEKAAHNTFLNTFPEVDLSCCLFHLGQNIYKRVMQEGFKVKYHEDDAFSLKVRCFVSLAFLPREEVIDGFDELVDDDDIPQALVSYFENTYIGPVRGRGQRSRRLEPIFSIASWNVHDRCVRGEPRTTNSLEGFHSTLIKSVSHDHPNIWTLIDTLKKEDVLAKTKLQKLRQGDEIITKKYRDCNKRILHLIENYDSSNKLQFLRAIAHNIKF